MKLAVAVDLRQENAPHVVQSAATWAVRVGGSLDLLFVRGPQVAARWIRDPGVRKLVEQELAVQEEADTSQLTELLQLVDEGHRGVAHMLRGSPVEALCDAAIAYDAVLMATHGRAGLEHLWLGSVAEQLIRRTTRTVIVLRLPNP